MYWSGLTHSVRPLWTRISSWPRYARSSSCHGTRMAEQLEVASQQGDVRRVRWLIRHFPGLVKPQRGFDIPPLLWASLYGHSEVCQMLLSLGVDANTQSVNGDNALHAACEAGRADVCAVLLEAGTDPRHATPDGLTPAMIAAQRGHAQALRALLQADGTLVYAADAEGHTALFHAVVYGRDDCVSALVEAGADLDWTDHEGNTAMDHAKLMKRETCRRMLQRAKSSRDQESERLRLLQRLHFLAHHSPPSPRPSSPLTRRPSLVRSLSWLSLGAVSSLSLTGLDGHASPRAASPVVARRWSEESLGGLCDGASCANTISTAASSSTASTSCALSEEAPAPAPSPPRPLPLSGSSCLPVRLLPRRLLCSNERLSISAPATARYTWAAKAKRDRCERLAAVAHFALRGLDANLFHQLTGFMAPHGERGRPRQAKGGCAQ